MGGQPKQPQVTQVPTKSPQQTQFLDSLLTFFSQSMPGQTIGGAYGGPGQANYSPITLGEGKGGTTPAGPRDRREPRSSAIDEALTGPIVRPFTEGQTGNFPKRRT